MPVLAQCWPSSGPVWHVYRFWTVSFPRGLIFLGIWPFVWLIKMKGKNIMGCGWSKWLESKQNYSSIHVFMDGCFLMQSCIVCQLANMTTSIYVYRPAFYSISLWKELTHWENGCHFWDNICKPIFFNESYGILIQISLKIVLNVSVNNNPALVQTMA